MSFEYFFFASYGNRSSGDKGKLNKLHTACRWRHRMMARHFSLSRDWFCQRLMTRLQVFVCSVLKSRAVSQLHFKVCILRQLMSSHCAGYCPNSAEAALKRMLVFIWFWISIGTRLLRTRISHNYLRCVAAASFFRPNFIGTTLIFTDNAHVT